MSLIEREPRYRINASQSTSNVWTFNATAEDRDTVIKMSNDPNDPGNIAYEPIGLKLLSMIKQTEEIFRNDGRALASDPHGIQLTPPKAYSKIKRLEWLKEKHTYYQGIMETILANVKAEMDKNDQGDSKS